MAEILPDWPFRDPPFFRVVSFCRRALPVFLTVIRMILGRPYEVPFILSSTLVELPTRVSPSFFLLALV